MCDEVSPFCRGKRKRRLVICVDSCGFVLCSSDEIQTLSVEAGIPECWGCFHFVSLWHSTCLHDLVGILNA